MDNKINYDALEQLNIDTSTHITRSNLDFVIDEELENNFTIKKFSFIDKVFSVVLKTIMYIFFPIYFTFSCALTINGKRNLKSIKAKSAITISNHVHNLDGMMVAIALFPRQIKIQVAEFNYLSKKHGKILRLVGAIPISTNETIKTKSFEYTNSLLSSKKPTIIQIYPEGSLWPAYTKIRSFKSGAFHFAVKHNLPVVPIAINFRQPKGVEKLMFWVNDFITIHIGKPEYPNTSLTYRESVDELKDRLYKKTTLMNKYFKILYGGGKIK